jgi:hypothetical protein
MRLASQSTVAGHLDSAVKSRSAAMYARTVTRELSAPLIKMIRDPLPLFGTVSTPHALLKAPRERLETEPHTTPRSHR